MRVRRPAIAVLAATLGVLLRSTAGAAQAPAPSSPHLLGDPAPVEPARATQLHGRSGALRAVVVETGDADRLHALAEAAGAGGIPYRWVQLDRPGAAELLGEPAYRSAALTPGGPGVWRLEAAGEPGEAARPELTVITLVPFGQKQGGRLNGYHIGRYPVEGSGRTDRYAPPAGFIEVTRENQHFQISEHFQLRHFLTKDQHQVWPKYLALDLRLIDKLELVIQELNAMGVRAERMHVMSGFRTPQYNGPGTGGRATLSRHTYGDAADVWVDNDADGYMDDLNGDGLANLRDAEVMLRAVERVERRYPELVGGAGLYVATSAHGPFIHIDVRGTPARW